MLHKYPCSGEINSTIDDPSGKIKEIEKKYSDGKIDYLDGVSIEYPDWRFNLRMSNTEPILRLNVESRGDEKLMKEKNVSILVFAEGTRSKTGEIQEFKRGAFRMASAVGYPIIPVTISGSNKIMPKGTFKLKSGIIKVHYDKPISTENIKTRQDEINLMIQVREVVLKNYK